MSSNSNSNSNSRSKGLTLKSRFRYAAHSVISSVACRPDGSVNRRLLNIADLKSPPSATPIDGVKSFDHTVDASRELWFRLYVPLDSQSSLPVLIYFHGGGFVSFSPSTSPFDALCRRLAGAVPCVVISVNYRHSPEHRYPSQYDDGFDVLKYIDGNKDKIDIFPANANLSRCFLAGDSAGGNLAHHVAVRATESGSEFEAIRIRGLLAIQPFFGGEDRTESELRLGKNTRLTLKKTHFYWKAFLPVGSDRDHPASNVFGPKAKDLSGINFPPTLVVVGGRDLLQDRQRSYCDGLKRSGKKSELVNYPNAQHGFYCTPELADYPMLISRIREFALKQLAHNSSFDNVYSI